MPKSREEFWTEKLGRNVVRDREVHSALLDAGWRIAVVWECVLRDENLRSAALQRLARWISGSRQTIELP
jgi:DNA mismatch endonuclease (patch repair protein)